MPRRCEGGKIAAPERTRKRVARATCGSSPGVGKLRSTTTALLTASISQLFQLATDDILGSPPRAYVACASKIKAAVCRKIMA